MHIEPIGIIKSSITEGVDENWGSVKSEIHLNSNLASGLKEIQHFSHIIVIFYMHQSTFDLKTDLVRRPKGRLDMPMLGIFAQRAKHRPNPIGITAVQLLGVEGNIINVRGLDAINGTPVLDIKPYFPIFDRIENPVVPEWVKKAMENYF